MDLRIEQSCPSCGAAIELHEDDVVVKCSFCDVNNYMLNHGDRRYVLPWSLPVHISERELYFIPYLRFKGSIFFASDNEVKHKLIDATRLGVTSNNFSVSLRLRPQAMKVRPVVADMEGQFLRQTIKTDTVLSQAAKISTLYSKSRDEMIYHRAFIGESLSRIYQPCYIHDDKLVDAIDNRSIGVSSLLENFLAKSRSSQTSWEPRFISTICPECGGMMSGEVDSLVLHCKNCGVLWQEQSGKFTRMKWRLIQSEERNVRYLPFWKISFETSGQELKRFGDFLRFTNQPVIVQKKHDELPLAFLIPAFKINPKTFLQLAAKMTVAQMKLPKGSNPRLENNYPVTLHWKEAVQSLKTVLAETTLNKQKLFPVLPKIKVGKAGYSLQYLPFIDQSHDLVQEHTHISVMAAALRYGRGL